MNGELGTTSLEAAFRRDYVQLCRLASLLVGGDRARAEELVMDAFVACIDGWHAVAGPGSGYLRRAVVNRCHDHTRRRRIEWRVNALHSARNPTSATQPEADDAVLRAVRALPPRQRTVVVLTYFADLPEAEVSAELGISAGTVKSQLAKARRSLARSLEEDR